MIAREVEQVKINVISLVHTIDVLHFAKSINNQGPSHKGKDSDYRH